MDTLLGLLQQEETRDTFLELALGLLMPVIVSGIKRVEWPNWIRVLVTLGISVLAATLIALINGEATWSTIFDKSAVIFATATIFFKTYFQTTQINSRLEGSSNNRATVVQQHSVTGNPGEIIQPVSASPNPALTVQVSYPPYLTHLVGQ